MSCGGCQRVSAFHHGGVWKAGHQDSNICRLSASGTVPGSGGPSATLVMAEPATLRAGESAIRCPFWRVRGRKKVSPTPLLDVNLPINNGKVMSSERRAPSIYPLLRLRFRRLPFTLLRRPRRASTSRPGRGVSLPLSCGAWAGARGPSLGLARGPADILAIGHLLCGGKSLILFTDPVLGLVIFPPLLHYNSSPSALSVRGAVGRAPFLLPRRRHNRLSPCRASVNTSAGISASASGVEGLSLPRGHGSHGINEPSQSASMISGDVGFTASHCYP